MAEKFLGYRAFYRQIERANDRQCQAEVTRTAVPARSDMGGIEIPAKPVLAQVRPGNGTGAAVYSFDFSYHAREASGP